MPLESFYGGKQGVAPVIKKSYRTIEEMEQASDIRYGEMCLIDTVSKNDSNNGKLYRRVFGEGKSGPDETDRAIQGYDYIGQIVGPASAPPMFDISSPKESLLERIRQGSQEEDANNYQEYYSFEDENGDLHLGVEKNTVHTLRTRTLNSIDLKKGSEDPTIKYSWVNVERINKQTEVSVTQALLGFEIPYTDFLASVSLKNWSDDPSVAVSQINNNPFYYQIDFEIPAGIPGCYVSNVRVVNTTDCCFGNTIPDKQRIYFYDTIDIKEDSENSGKYFYDFQEKAYDDLSSEIQTYLFDNNKGMTNVIQDQNILVYDITYAYSADDENFVTTTRTCFLDFYRSIENISLVKESEAHTHPSKLQISYSSANNSNNGMKTQSLGSIPYVDKIEIEGKSQKLYYRTADESQINLENELTTLNSIEATTIDIAGDLLILYTSSENRKAIRLNSVITEEDLNNAENGTIPTSFTDDNGISWKYNVPEIADYTLSEKFKENNGISLVSDEKRLLWRNLGKVRIDNYREGLKVASIFDWGLYPENVDSDFYLERVNTVDKMKEILNQKNWTGSLGTKLNPYFDGSCTPAASETLNGDKERVLICPIFRKDNTDELKFQYQGFFYDRQAAETEKQQNSGQLITGHWINIGNWSSDFSDLEETNLRLINTAISSEESNENTLPKDKTFNQGFSFIADTIISENSSNDKIFSPFWSSTTTLFWPWPE